MPSNPGDGTLGDRGESAWRQIRILIPAKASPRSKARLAEVLDGEGRTLLMEALLERCLGAVEAAAAHHRTAIHRVVVTGDARAEAIALRYGASLAPDVGLGPNVAIASALAVHANASECLCVLAADLPLVDEHGVWALIRTARRGHFAIGPDRLGTGTNALALPYADPTFPFSFGPHSRARHIEAAVDRGWHVEVLRCPALSVDLDESWDLDLAGRRA